LNFDTTQAKLLLNFTTQAVQGLDQEWKVDLWLGSHISRYICFIKLEFSLIIKLGVFHANNVTYRINYHPVDRVVCFVNTYPLDSVIQPSNNWDLDCITPIQKPSRCKLQSVKTDLGKIVETWVWRNLVWQNPDDLIYYLITENET